jgi:hypothetical protein
MVQQFAATIKDSLQRSCENHPLFHRVKKERGSDFHLSGVGRGADAIDNYYIMFNYS